MVRYIHLDPYRTGLVKSLSHLDKHPWAGHSALVGEKEREWQETGEVLSCFDESKAKARQAYRKFVREGAKKGYHPHLSHGRFVRRGGGIWQITESNHSGQKPVGDERILGDSDFAEMVLNHAGQERAKKR